MTTAWEAYSTAANAAVIEIRRRGLLDDTSSDGRFARRLMTARREQREHPAVRHFAYLVARRHSDLCEAIGTPFHSIIPEPEPPGYSVTDVQQALGVQAKREAARAEDTTREAYRPGPKRVTVLGEDLAISFPYSQRRVEALKVIPGRRWDPERRIWTAPISQWPKVLKFAKDHNLLVTDQADRAIAAAQAAGVGDDAKYHIFIDDLHKHLIYRGGFVADIVARFREIPERRYVERTKEWWVPAKHADVVERIAKQHGLIAHPSAAPFLKQWSEAADEMRALSRAQDAELEVPGVVCDLFGFQRAGIAYAEKAGFRLIIGDEQGLGKTRQAIAAAELHGQWPVIVVCPSKVEIGWRREIVNAVPHRTVVNLTGRSPQYPFPAEFYVIGWPNVAAWLNVLLSLQARGLIVDESQYAKNHKAARTKAVKAVAGSHSEKDIAAGLVPLMPTRGAPIPPNGLRILTTGTFTMNRTEEIIEQLRIANRLDDLGGEKVIRSRYCNLKNLDPDEIRSRRKQFHEELRAVCLVRRKKKDVLADLPEKLRAFLWVEPDPKVMVEYREAEADVLAYLARKAREAALKLGKDPASAEVMARMRAGGAAHLVVINVLRQLAAKAKIGAATEWAETFLEGTEESLIVYGHHRDGLLDLKEKLDAEAIMGGQTQRQAQGVIDRFQDRSTRTVVLSIMAAGVGLTLTAASTGLFLEQAWNPGTLYQAEDRMHRIGQVNTVTCYYMLCEGTIDVDMIELLETKREEVDWINDGQDVETWDPDAVEDPEKVMSASGSIVGDLIERLTKRALGVAEK